MNIFSILHSRDIILIAIFFAMIFASIYNWSIIISKIILFLKINIMEIEEYFENEIQIILSKNSNQKSLELIVDNLINLKEIEFQKNLNFLATSASIIPFVGLLGTVIGIANALHDISSTSVQNINIISGPIADALSSTAIGLFVAIPAGFFYNYFTTKIENILLEVKSKVIIKLS